MNVKNVVIINDFNYVQGGASKVAIDTAKILKNSNMNIYFFSAVNKEEENIEGINYITTNQEEALKSNNKLKGAINGIYNFKAKNKLKQLLKTLDKRETIIHIHGWTKALSSSVFDVAFKMDFKVVLTLHDYFTACPNGGYFNYKTLEICKFNPLSLKCIKCNCDSRNYLVKLYRVIREFVQNKIVKLNKRLHYCISISNLSETILKQTLNKNIEIIKINNPVDMQKEQYEFQQNSEYIYIGRISKEKGTELFCKALKELNKTGIVVGDGPMKDELQKQYDNIKFVGWQSKEKIKEYLEIARAMIFTSLWYETMGLTALEALSKGVPVLVGDNCATMEFIVDGRNGFIYKMGDLEDLKDKIQKCSDMKIKEMSQNAYQMYWDNPLSNERYKKEIQKCYEKVINAGN